MMTKMVLRFEEKHHFDSLEDTVRAGLKNESMSVRKHAARQIADLTPCPKDLLEEALTHSDVNVRFSASLQEIQYTPTQIERGLTDKSALVRGAFARYSWFKPTPEQAARGVADESSDVRKNWVNREDADWSSEQVSALLKDGKQAVVLALIRNPRTKFTTEQIEVGLRSKSAEKRKAFLERRDFYLSDKQIKRLFKETNVDVLEVYVSREDVKLDAKQVDWVFHVAIEGAKKIPKSMRQDFNDHIFRGEHILIALAKREYFLPTVAQEKRVLDLPNDLWLLKRTFVDQEARWNAARQRLALIDRCKDSMKRSNENTRAL